jgi:hypothetical protein
MRMTFEIGTFKIKTHKSGALNKRLVEPLKNLSYAMLSRKIAVVGNPIRGSTATNRHIGPWPKHCCSDLSLASRRVPNRFAAPPTGIAYDSLIGERKCFAYFRIFHVVANNAVIFRIETSNNRIVIGKGESGKHGTKAFNAYTVPS